MLTRLSLFAAVLLAASAMAAPVLPTDRVDAPTVYAVVFSAEWCGACTVLEPKLMPVMQSMQGDAAVQFVTFDFTNRETSNASEATAAALDLATVYAAHAGKTGFVLLVDAQSGEVIDRILSTDDSDGMRAKILGAIASAS